MSSAYVSSRPGWQKGRSGHSGGPPSTIPPQAAANSDSDVTSFSSAKAAVTANAFWSAAAAASPNTRPTCSPRPVSASTVDSRSPLASGVASAPFTDLLRNSVSVPTYSGTTVSSPFCSAGRYVSRLPMVRTSAVYPARRSAAA